MLGEIERENSESLYVVAAIRLLMLTGARVSEILTLKSSYVDFDRQFLLLPDSKTGQKQIALSTAAVEVLQNIPSVRNNVYVIIGRIEKPASSTSRSPGGTSASWPNWRTCACMTCGIRLPASPPQAAARCR